MPDQIEIVDENGVVRKLGNIPAPLKLRWNCYGDVGMGTPPLIPEDEWKDRIDALNMAYLDVPNLPPTHDQDGIGQCNCDATGAFMEYIRAEEGLEYIPLSAGDLYGRINGGYDGGSLLEDAVAKMLSEGIGTVKTYGGNLWNGGSQGCPTSERNLYRLLEVWNCPTPAHVMSASLMGFGGVIGIMWYSNFSPDAKGNLPENGRGDAGGHALFKFPGAKYELVGNKIKYYIPLQNSWRDSWSQWHGRCWLPINHLSGQVGGHWVGRATVAQDQNPMPAPKQ